jgi:CBS domain-containing protein
MVMVIWRVIDSAWYRRNGSEAVKKGFSLLHVMEVMAREGVHRVCVLDDHQQVIGITTQSMILSLISQNVALLDPAKGTPVSPSFLSFAWLVTL